MKWIGRKQSSPPVQPADTREAEAGMEALAYLQALRDSIAGNVKDRGQVTQYCQIGGVRYAPAYIAKYLQRVQRYQDEPAALKRDQGLLVSHGWYFCLAAVWHAYTEAAHGR